MTNAQQTIVNARLGAISLLYSLGVEVDLSDPISISPELEVELHLSLSIFDGRIDARFFGFCSEKSGGETQQFTVSNFSSWRGLDHLDDAAAEAEAERINSELQIFLSKVREIASGARPLELETETRVKVKKF